MSSNMSRDVTLQVDNGDADNAVTAAPAQAANGKPPRNASDETTGSSFTEQQSRMSTAFALGDYWTSSSPGRSYKDIDGESDLQRPDKQRQDRSYIHWIRTVLRGRSLAMAPLLLTVAWSCVVMVATWLTSRSGYRKDQCRWWCTYLALDNTTHSYVGFALFLLLGFRANESYSRYMEGVKIWTAIGGTVTSFSQYVLQAFKPGMFHDRDHDRILGFLVAFPVALKRELRDENDLRELKNVLSPDDLSEMQNAPSMTSHVIYVLSAYLLKARAKEDQFPQTFLIHLIKWIGDLASAADMCIQIKTMPCAFSYVAHLRTFLALWLFFLPFTLVESAGWITPVIVAFIAYGVIGIEANAAELENPFGKDYNDLPLGLLARNIREGVLATYRAAQTGVNKYVHDVSPPVPEPGEVFWLEDKEKAL